jgi:RNA polymerase sigma-70 factor (ECF subfamily)
MVPAGSAEGETALPAESAEQRVGGAELSQAQMASFHALYRDQFTFVFRNLRRLGVPREQVDDALQDVFLVVLRHLGKYEAGTHGKAWLFAIALRVARNYRRSQRRRDNRLVPAATDAFSAPIDQGPFERAASAQAAALLRNFLEGIDEDKRSVFIMTELEQLSAPEIASALAVNLNTVYTRIRAARREFARIVAEARQKDDAHGTR